MATTYSVGAVARLTDQVKINGVLTDCATVVFTVHPQGGPDQVYTLAAGQVVRDGVGTYHVDVLVTVAGTWTYGVVTTSPGSAADKWFWALDPVP